MTARQDLLVDICLQADMNHRFSSLSLLPVEKVFRALSDPTRLRILMLLREEALCVGDLVAVLEIPQPTASRHLTYLLRSGLVLDERRGKWVFYKRATVYTAFHQQLLATLSAAESRQNRIDAAALRALRKAGGGCPQ